jgi:hypothetical protein
MSDFVGVWAEIQLADADVKKWLAREASGSTWDDWAGVLEDAGGGSEGTVSDLIDEAKERAPEAPYFVKVDVKKGKISARAVLSPDDDMDACADLCVALRAADELGGEGDIFVTSLTDDSINAHVKLGKKKSRCSEAKSSDLEPVIEALTAD